MALILIFYPAFIRDANEKELTSTRQAPNVIIRHDPAQAHRTRLMAALDAVNDKYGRGTLTVASAGTAGARRQMTMKQNRRSADYTTDWRSILVAYA